MFAFIAYAGAILVYTVIAMGLFLGLRAAKII